MCGEWTYEGGEKAQITEQVIPDGSRGRYPGGAHGCACKVDAFASMWVVPQILYLICPMDEFPWDSFFIYTGMKSDDFIAKEDCGRLRSGAKRNKCPWGTRVS